MSDRTCKLSPFHYIEDAWLTRTSHAHSLPFRSKLALCIALLHKSVSRGLEGTQRRRKTFSSRSYLAAFVAPCAARRTPSILPDSLLVPSLARPTPVSLERSSLRLQRSRRKPRPTTALATLSSFPATTSRLIPPVSVPFSRLLLLPPRSIFHLPSASPQ